MISLAAFAALSAVAGADQLDDFINAEMARQKVPGLTLAIVKDGKVVRTGAYGKADLELDVPSNVDNVFEIGSMTKQFTAALTLLLMEDGKLSLDDPISKYIDEAPKTWDGITIRHLLNHTSGLKEYVVIPGLLLTEEFERKTFLEKVRPLSLDFEPGVTFAYSNTNFAFLGIVLEKITGKHYEELITERILKPLEMNDTKVLDPDAIQKNRSHGYMAVQGNLYRSRPSMLSNIADGALISTVKDIAKWDIGLHSGKVLKESSMKLLTTPGKLNSGRSRPYGFGTFLTPLGAKPFIGHHGASAGYSAGYGHFPTANLAVIVMTNVYAINGQQMVTSIAEILEPSLKVTPPAAQTDPNAARTDKVKAAIGKLAANTADDAVLEPEVIAPMKTDRARMGPGPYGALRTMDGLTFLSEETYGEDKLLTYRLSTPQRDFIVRVVWSKNDKIADIGVRPDGPVKTAK